MRTFWCGTALIMAGLASDQARACMANAPLDLADISYADVIVVGRIADYHIVPDEAFRRQMGRSDAGPGMLMSDYARFTIQVDEVLRGQAPATLSVTWDNSTFSEPASMSAGPFVIALRRPNSGMPPLRGPSATVGPGPDPSALTVLQAPCSAPFIFETRSEEARSIRRRLAARPH